MQPGAQLLSAGFPEFEKRLITLGGELLKKIKSFKYWCSVIPPAGPWKEVELVMPGWLPIFSKLYFGQGHRSY